MSHEKKRRRSRKQFIIFVITLALGICGAWYLVNWYDERELLRAYFISPAGVKSSEYKLEVAANDRTRHFGLMYRKEMARDRGMLFVFPKEELQSFWMENTYIPLDMIFIDSKSVVVGVLHDVPVLNTEARTVGTPSTFVIELNAGEAKKLGVDKGWRVEYNRRVEVVTR